MRISKRDNGYSIWLSARDTHAWANKPGAVWPCSTLSGHRLVVMVDRNGICEAFRGGREVRDRTDVHEIEAIVADHLPKGLRHLWPVWEKSEAA